MSGYDVLVVGAGLSGLTAAWQLHQQGYSVCVLEADGDVGGVIRTIKEDGFLLESGPNTFQSTGRAIMSLLSRLGLTPIETEKSAKKRYLFYEGKLHALPHNPVSFLLSPLMSVTGKFGVFTEAFHPPATDELETVSEFVARRLGPEVLSRFVEPFVSGVYAGDADQLEMASAFPKLKAMEKSAGSLTGGLLKRSAPKNKIKYGLLGFKEGMQTLPYTLASQLPEGAIRLNTLVSEVSRSTQGYTCILASGEAVSAPALILATPADVSAKLLKTVLPEASDILAEIPYAPVATVHYGFDRKTIFHSLDGFGFLVPKSENLKLLGSIWASSLFLNRAPQGNVLFSCFMGGARNTSMLDMTEDEIDCQVLKDLSTVLNQPVLEPLYRKTILYHKAIPQYTVGHQNRVTALQEALKVLSGLLLCGNYLTGVSLNDCVESGLSAAEMVSKSLSVKPYAEKTS